MLLRRLGLAVPLAFLVAVLMHVALFGVRHAPGAEHAGRLGTMLAAGLSLAALCAVLFFALERRTARARRVPRLSSPFELAAGGGVAFALIELAEGHTPLGGGSWEFAALAASAFTVAHVARLIARLLRRSGEAFAAFARSAALLAAPVVILTVRRSPIARGAVLVSASRGRAPPLFS